MVYHIETMKSLGKRLKALRNILGLSQTQMASKLGIAQYQTISTWEKEKKIPSAENMEKINNAFNINLTWLITGKGGMYDKKDESPYQVQYEETESSRRVTIDIPYEKPEKQPVCDDCNVIEIPVLDHSIAAGAGVLLDYSKESDWEDVIRVTDHDLFVPGVTYFALRIAGNSMLEVAPDGFLAVIRRVEMPDPKALAGKVVAAVDSDGALVLKWLKYQSGKLFLISENMDYTPIEYTEDCRLIGYCVMVLKYMPEGK